jgi:predicted Zn-dependent peptidase
MNSIVFQDLRESRALAYSARASYSRPERKTDAYIFNANIITQNDKANIAVR